MKKKLITAATALIIGGAAWIVNSSQISVPSKDTSDAETIKIGIIMPLSGKDATLGKKLKQGFDLVKNQNRYGKKFKLIYKDSKTKTEEIPQIAKELAETANVDAFITYGATSAEIVAPIAAKYHVLQFACAHNPAFTRYKGNYILTPNAEAEAQILSEAIKNRGYTTVALISDDDFYNNLLGHLLRKAVVANDLELVFDTKINAETTDYKAILNEAKVQNPDIYILQVKSPALEKLVKQLKNGASKRPFTAAHVFLSSPQPELFEGQFFLGIGTSDNEFNDFFRENYGKHPNPIATLSYSATDLMLKTLTSIDDIEIFYDRLKEIAGRDKSVLGKLRVKERQINYPSLLQEFRKGKIVTVPNEIKVKN